MAARLSGGARSRGLGRVWSLGSQEESSSLARLKFGWRERVVKASAQERVNSSGEAGLDAGGCGGRAAFLRVGAVDLQQPPLLPAPPQQPPDGVPLADREAASVLQKRVLRGSARHWAQVPGPLAHGFVACPIGGRVTSERASPSDGGGVN